MVPERNPGIARQALNQLEKIRTEIKSKQILPFYSEAVFGVELLNKKIQHNVLREAKLHEEWKQKSPDHMTLTIGTRWGNREEIYTFKKSRMDKASEMGFKALIGPRHLGGGLNTTPIFICPMQRYLILNYMLKRFLRLNARYSTETLGVESSYAVANQYQKTLYGRKNSSLYQIKQSMKGSMNGLTLTPS